MRIQQILSSSILTIAFALSDCADLGAVYTPPRIIPGVSIDGVRFGDSPKSVEERIGKAPNGYAMACGGTDGKAWFVACYLDGSHAGLTIEYLDLVYLNQLSAPGPVDLFELMAPYQGKTAEGIGIGSSVADVHTAYGEAEKSWTQDDYRSGLDYYCYGSKWIYYSYEDSIVALIWMGVLYPPPGEAICR